jgi:hypothetical protein
MLCSASAAAAAALAPPWLRRRLESRHHWYQSRCRRCQRWQRRRWQWQRRRPTGVGAGSQREVRVWALAELELQHTLPQPAGSDVRARLVVDGEEGGGVGMEGVKRGRRGARGWGGERGIGSMGCKEDPGPGRIRGIRGNVIASQKTRFPCVWSHPLENKSRLT